MLIQSCPDVNACRDPTRSRPAAWGAGIRRPAIWDDAEVSDGQGIVPNVVRPGLGSGPWPPGTGGARCVSAALQVAEVPEALFGLPTALFWLGDMAGTIANCEKA
jgi:hypothetical protein